MIDNKIEFFHDTICSFCFPMSYKMRIVKENIPDLNIIHRSFALARDEKDFNFMFNSREKAKEEVLKHWEHANQVDILHRFNIDGMRNADFLFPISMPSLYACKAAFYISDDNGYWDLFDKLQESFFVKTLNIQNDDIIYKCVKETNLDFNKWEEVYKSEKVKQAVEDDLALVEHYGIHEVPTLVINEKYRINGALDVNELISKIQSIIG